MAISRDFILKINGDKASLTESLYVYLGDKNIDIYITIEDIKFKFTNTTLLRSIENAFASATIVKPNKEEFGIPHLDIIGDKVKFVLTEDMLDEVTEVGTYQVQFHLKDNGGARLTIPNFTFEVKSLIANVDNITQVAIVDTGEVGNSIVAEDIPLIYRINGKTYIPTTWKSGDLITATKLNKIELKLLDLESKANADHTHTDYAPSEHTHSQYAPSDHNHNGYSASGHTHTEYEPKIATKGTAFNKNFGSAANTVSEGNHSHSGYANSSHSHSGYANSSHTHNDYSPTNHTHSGYVTTAALTNAIGSHKIWSGTKAQYDAVATKDPNTLYFVIKEV